MGSDLSNDSCAIGSENAREMYGRAVNTASDRDVKSIQGCGFELDERVFWKDEFRLWCLFVPQLADTAMRVNANRSQ
jgi:hypothetical protein